MKFSVLKFLLSLACALAVTFVSTGCDSEETSEPILKTCSETTCGQGGRCDDSTGALLCFCNRGYDGNRCQFCADGFEEDGAGKCRAICDEGAQDNDSDGLCAPACAPGACGEHAQCDDASGEVVCSCDGGYQDNDGDGVCAPACALDTCGAHGQCDDASGEAKCTCDQGYIFYTDTCVDAATLSSWTLMVFLNGDNNLCDYSDEDVTEMMSGLTANGATRINLIVLHDREGALECSGSGATKLYRIANGTKETLDHDGAIFSGSEADMGDWNVLKKFGVWAIENYPAQRYGLVLWNHGAGWKKDGGLPRPLFKGFSNDDHGNYDGIELSNGDYGKALQAMVNAAGRKLDLVGFDACLMGMYEVATTTSNYADYLVASEETVPAEGWAYDVFLRKLSSNPDMGPIPLGKEIVDSYANDSTYNDTLSLTDLTSMGELHPKVSAFANALKNSLTTHKSTITSLRNQTKYYTEDSHIDFQHFAELIAAKSSLPTELKSSANDLIAQLKKSILLNRTNSYSYYGYVDNSNSNGMAIWFPTSLSSSSWDTYVRSDLTRYETTWGSVSTWASFLDAYL
ncbi:MAG: hypothetical protein LBM75_00010 [Myxococcales bacterium]|jgi:hypothetical protein|nr:hypothetical protein [Myxococcales bacterium]